MSKLIANDTYQKEYTKDFVSCWDDLIGWEGREKGEGGFFQRLLAAHGCKSVADVACGTGFHSVILARDGFDVTAADGSENMVRQTVENGQKYGVHFAASHVVDWLHLKEEFGENAFDSVVCLGNALTHLFEHESRRDALMNMYSILKPGGMIIVDHRNYDSILDEGYNSKAKYYYTGNGVNAEPVEISRTLCRFEYTFPSGDVFHLRMYPLKQQYMEFLLEDAGFMDVTAYGDFLRPFERYDPDFIQQVAFKPRIKK